MVYIYIKKKINNKKKQEMESDDFKVGGGDVWSSMMPMPKR
jgi:hypothetical protein